MTQGFELATDAEDQETIDVLQRKLNSAFDTLEIESKDGKMVKIIGNTSVIINDAQDITIDTNESKK